MVHVDNGALLANHELYKANPLLILDAIHNRSSDEILLREIQVELLVVLPQHRLAYSSRRWCERTANGDGKVDEALNEKKNRRVLESGPVFADVSVATL